VADLLHQVGIDWHRQTFWDADHMVPVEDGGGACGLDNYQTLCIPCHKSKTAEQAAQKAKRRQRQGV
jgi:5-methylcytosine-specific restriction endonuclease McrA